MNREFWRGREELERDRDEDLRYGRGDLGRDYGREYAREGRWREERPIMGRMDYPYGWDDQMYGGYESYGGQWRGWGDRDRPGYGRRERGLGERARGFFGRMGEEIREIFGRPSRHYTRSDERIREDVYERLMDQNWIDADDVEVRVDKAEVTLTGTVPTRRDKRLVEEIAEACLGVKDVHNQLRIVKNGSATATSTTETKKPRA